MKTCFLIVIGVKFYYYKLAFIKYKMIIIIIILKRFEFEYSKLKK